MAERLMWAKWRGKTRLIWVHKIIKQVKEGWIIDMRETTQDSKETTKKKIAVQGKGDANARYGKVQLDKKKAQGFKWTRTVTIDQSRKQDTVKKLTGPISVPMFTTNPNQHMNAHLLAWLPLHNKKRAKETSKTRRKQMQQKKDNTEEDTDWHPIGNVEGVCAHKAEGLRKQLKQWEAEAEAMRYEGDTPTILLGSDASTLSEDPHAAVAGAWLAIGVFTTRELQSKNMKKWRERIKWKNREAYGGAKMCWGTKKDRTIMAGETLAILLAMKSIRTAKGGVSYTGTKITLPVDNESAMRKYQTIEHKEDTELINEANLDLWIAIREEKKYWKKKFHVVTINSHEVDSACKKGTDFAHEKNSGVKEATPLQIANWYADKWAKAYRRQESENKRYSSRRPREIEEKCKWRLYHNGEMISGSMNKRIKEIVEQHHIKMYFQSKTLATSSCRLGESKEDHWGHIIDTKIHETAIEVWMNKHGNRTFPWKVISQWYPLEQPLENRGRRFENRRRNIGVETGKCECGATATMQHIICGPRTEDKTM